MIDFIEQISFNWFLLYYFSLGLILLYQGYIWSSKPKPFCEYLAVHAKNEEQPKLVIKTLRYLFLFSALSFVLAFFPISTIEIIFSVWSLLMIYLLGSFFLQWKTLSKMILEKPGQLERQIKKGGVMMLSLGVIMFLLAYALLTGR
jgi:hypothetical protein